MQCGVLGTSNFSPSNHEVVECTMFCVVIFIMEILPLCVGYSTPPGLGTACCYFAKGFTFGYAYLSPPGYGW